MVIIIGDRCLDIYSYGHVRRICPEAPVPVFDSLPFGGGGEGMAGNVAKNFEALGIEYKLFANVKCEAKLRYFDDISGQMILRVDSKPEYNFDHEIERFANVADSVDYSEAEAVVISDYDKHYFASADLETIRKNFSGPIFIDTKKPLGEWLKEVTCVKVNEKEWTDSGMPAMDNLCVTRGQNGATWQDGQCIRPAEQVRARDVCGAGDSFLAALVAKYLRNQDILESIRFAVNCASEVVQHQGVVQIPKEMREQL